MKKCIYLLTILLFGLTINTPFAVGQTKPAKVQTNTDDSFKPDQSKLPVHPPTGAIAIFSGNEKHLFVSMSGEASNWPIKNGALVSTQKRGNTNHLCSKVHFRDADIHVEFMLPKDRKGNSGVYIHGNYELQILNSHQAKSLTQQEMGSVYGFAPPLVNAARPPGEWQVYDIRYRAPRRDAGGKIVKQGSITAWLNGQKVQHQTRLGEPRSVFHPFRHGNTAYLDRIYQSLRKNSVGPLFLQDHNHPVQFRNVWIKPLDDKSVVYERTFDDRRFNAVAWMQQSAEYHLLTKQTYRHALQQLERGLSDQNWTADEVQLAAKDYRDKKTAVILDVDETVLDNSAFNARNIVDSKNFKSTIWNAWCEEEKALAIPGALDFIHAAESKGVKVFYITNRDDALKTATLNNLRKLGFKATAETVLTRNGQQGRGDDKVSRRAMVAEKHRILLLIGDSLSDMCSGMGTRDQAQRNATAIDKAKALSQGWIVMPNPVYGSWERALPKGSRGLRTQR